MTVSNRVLKSHTLSVDTLRYLDILSQATKKSRSKLIDEAVERYFNSEEGREARNRLFHDKAVSELSELFAIGEDDIPEFCLVYMYDHRAELYDEHIRRKHQQKEDEQQ